MNTRLPARSAALLRTLAALLLGALLLMACTAPATGEPAPTGGTGGTTAPAGELAGTRWVLSDLNGTAPVAEATLQFDAEGRLAGTTGCNQYGGSYSVEGANLAVGELVSTEMACTADGVMQQELNFLNALSQATGYSIVGETLTIEAADGARLVFTRA